jgi:hypothetical protein
MGGQTDGQKIRNMTDQFSMKLALMSFLAFGGTKVVFMKVALMLLFSYRWQ